MGNVQTILSIVRKFTPAGQEMALKLLKENRRVLSREFGFVELPSIISGQEKTKLLEEQLLDRSGSIRGIVSNELGKCTKELTAENIQGIHMGYMIASTMGIKGQKI